MAVVWLSSPPRSLPQAEVESALAPGAPASLLPHQPWYLQGCFSHFFCSPLTPP